MKPETTATRDERGQRFEEAVTLYHEAAGRIDRQVILDLYPDVSEELRQFFGAEDSLQRHLGGRIEEKIETASGADRYEMVAPISRGGMGEVWRARDRVLGREVALKLLRGEFRDGPEWLARFRKEAQRASQMQHPGIVPVHDAGVFSDGRPFFTMKLIEGRTLAELLAERPSPRHQLGHFLDIFHQVCQAVAYAHSRGVLHRDLKPANVMVGAFGEVQVMDWGLGKEWRGAEASGTAPPDPGSPGHLADSTQPEGLTDARSALGTWPYMPPEQARGDLGRVGPPSDVFGLGAVLCVILTGEPPYTGSTREEVECRARLADLAAAQGRVEQSGADRDLIALAKRCLASDPADRPANAEDVAHAVAAYQEGVRARLRQAELRQTRRKWQMLAAGVLLLAVVLGSAAWIGLERRHAARRLQAALTVSETLTDVRGTRARAEEKIGQPEAALGLWEQAQATLRGVADPDELDEQTRGELERTRGEVDAGVAAAKRRVEESRRNASLLAGLRNAAALLHADMLDLPFSRKALRNEYHRVLGEHGLGLKAGPASVLTRRIERLPDDVRVEVILALDVLSLVSKEDAQPCSRILTAVDRDPFRRRLRAALAEGRLDTFKKLAAEPRWAQRPAQSFRLLGDFLLGSRLEREALAVFKAAAHYYPDDFWINLLLAKTLKKFRSRHEEAVGYFRAALVSAPGNARVWAELGQVLDELGKGEEADRCYAKALSSGPRDYHPMLLRASRGFIRLDLRLCEADCRELERAHGAHPEVQAFLLCVEAGKGTISAAGVARLEALHRADPLDEIVQFGRLMIAFRRGRFREAAGISRALGRQCPDSVTANTLQAFATVLTGEVAAAQGAARRVLALGPKQPFLAGTAHLLLAAAGMWQGQLAEAEQHARQGARLLPDVAPAWECLALTLFRQGRIREAREVLDKVPTRKQIPFGGNWINGFLWTSVQLPLFLRAASRLEAIETGKDKVGVVETYFIAEAAFLKGKFLLSYQVYAEVLKTIPAWTADFPAYAWNDQLYYLSHRVCGARAAILAAAGNGTDLKKLDAATRAAIRLQGLSWLRTELQRQRSWQKTTRLLPSINAFLHFLKYSPEFAGVRHPAALAKLPKEEQQQWRRLWEGVDELLEQMKSAPPK